MYGGVKRFSASSTIWALWILFIIQLQGSRGQKANVPVINITGFDTESGYIKSPNFPSLGLTPVIYRLVSKSTSSNLTGFIELKTIDIFVSYKSRLLIYDCDCEENDKKTIVNKRIYFVSTGNIVTVKYEPNVTNDTRFSGDIFKFEYKFITEMPNERVVMNESVCSTYNLLGLTQLGRYVGTRAFKSILGHVTFPQFTNWTGDSIVVDCAWSFFTAHRYMWIDTYAKIISSGSCYGMELEVRDSWHSEGALLAKGSPYSVRHLHMPSTGWSQDDGVFLRLTGRLTKSCSRSKFVFAYAPTGSSRLFFCSFLDSYYFCEKQKHCVPEHLKCDGYDHCGDGEDEGTYACSGITTTTEKSCPLAYYKCADGSCKFFSSDCKENQRSCPYGEHLCSDGSCRSFASQCSDYESYESDDRTWVAWAVGIPAVLISIMIIICKQCMKQSRRQPTYSTQMQPISAGPAATTDMSYMRASGDGPGGRLLSDYHGTSRPSPFVTPNASPNFTPRHSGVLTDMPDPNAPPTYSSLETDPTPSVPHPEPTAPVYDNNLQPGLQPPLPGFRDGLSSSASPPSDDFVPPPLLPPSSAPTSDDSLPPPPSYDDVVQAGSNFSVHGVGNDSERDV